MKVSVLRKALSALAPWCLLLLPRRASSTKVESTCTTVLIGVGTQLTKDELDAFEVAWMNKFNDIWEFLPYTYQVEKIKLLSETVTPVRRRLDSDVADEEEEDGGIASRRLRNRKKDQDQNSQGDNEVQTNNDGTCCGCPPGELPGDELRRMLPERDDDDYISELMPSSNYEGWVQLAGDLVNELKLTNETAFDTLEGVRIHCDSMSNEFEHLLSKGMTTKQALDEI